MQDLNERIRRFIELMTDRSGRAIKYWDQLPPMRLGNEFLNRAEALVESLTTGKGEVTDNALDLAFLCFLFSEKQSQIKEVMERVQASDTTEQQVEHDPDREEWERKKMQERGDYWWKG